MRLNDDVAAGAVDENDDVAAAGADRTCETM